MTWDLLKIPGSLAVYATQAGFDKLKQKNKDLSNTDLLFILIVAGFILLLMGLFCLLMCIGRWCESSLVLVILIIILMVCTFWYTSQRID